MLAVAIALIAAGLGLALLQWAREAGDRAFRAIVEAFEVDIAADLDDRLEDDDG
jgi:hypothetical protein